MGTQECAASVWRVVMVATVAKVCVLAALCAMVSGFDSESAVSPLEDMQMFVDEDSGFTAEQLHPHLSKFMKELPPPSDFENGDGDEEVLGESAKWFPKYEESGDIKLETDVFNKLDNDKAWIKKEEEAYQAGHKHLMKFEERVKHEIERYESGHT